MRIAVVAIALVPLFGQEPLRPSFDAVSIRPGAMRAAQCPDKPLRAIGIACGGPGTSDPGRYTGHSVQLKSVILRAFGVRAFQLIGPDWIATVRYDITAVIPPGSTQEQFNQMMQGMLEDRFKLQVHHEMREVSAYNLVPAKGGLKLKESIPTDGCSMGAASVKGKTCGPRSEGFGIASAASSEGEGRIMTSPTGLMAGKNIRMDWFASAAGQQTGEIVLDKTGLSGAYDFRMEFSPVDLRTPFPSIDDSPLPSIFEALQQQLGLRLERVKTMMEVMVIDRVEKPTEN
jgi:uncharacterized protein (TIGR03435 family)